MPKRKWYVVTVGRDVGVFSTWIEVGPLVKGVPGAIHQSFLTRAEATRMFTEEQARGRTRIVDPDFDVTPAVNSPQRARNYSAPSPFPQATSAFGITPTHRGHDRSPLSVHPTTTSSRNRTNASTPSPVLLSDRRAPIMSGTSNSSPATFISNPRSGLDMSPSLRRLQLIQAALEQESAARQVRTPLCSNTNTSNSQSLTPVPGPSSSSRSRPLRRAETVPDIPQSPRTYTPSRLPVSATRNRESASTSVGFDVRAQPVNHIGHSSHTNACAYTQPNMTSTGGARTSNPPVKSASEPTSPSRGLQRTPPDTFHSNSRWAAFGHSPGRSSVSPRAIVRTPEWLPSYPTARTPSPDSDSSVRTRSPSPGPIDELLSPLSNVNLNSFALDDHPRRGINIAERIIASPSVNSRTSPPTPWRLNTQSQSPPIFANGIQSSIPSRRSGNEITHDSDPRSPILSPDQLPALACKNALEISFVQPSPRVNSRPLASPQLSNFSVDGHGPSMLFRH